MKKIKHHKYMVVVKCSLLTAILNNARYQTYPFDTLYDAQEFMYKQNRHSILYEFVEETNA